MASGREPDRAHTILIFEHRRAADAAIQALIQAGIREDRIGLFVHAPTDAREERKEIERAIDEGGAAGAGLGALAGTALFAIPGMGPVLGTGALAAALAGAITGVTIGGFSGSLVGLGISEAQAAIAEREMHNGRAVLLVQDDRRRDAVARIGKKYGAINILTA